MLARFATPVALVLALATATGCAYPNGSSDGAGIDEQTGTVTQAVDEEGGSLLSTAIAFGGKLGPVLSVASAIYGYYQNIPGKLDAMNEKLSTIVSNTTEIQRQVSELDAKLDAQFQADVVGPLAAAENYIAIDMKNQMTMLSAPGNENVANDWAVYSDALNTHYAAADTASQKLLAYFFPNGTTKTYTPAQSQHIFGLYLRASLVKVALRDAKATLAMTYSDRTHDRDYAVAQATAVANLKDTVTGLAPQLRSMKAAFITARDVPGALAQACAVSGTYTVVKTVPSAKGSRNVNVTRNYYAFRDPGGSFTSQNYKDPDNCTVDLNRYKAPLAKNVDAWVNDNMEAPIAGLEALPANWDAALQERETSL